MAALRARTQIPVFFLILALVAIALAVGLSLGNFSSTDDSDSVRQLNTELLNHKGSSSGKACEPRGNYGHVKNPPPHCTP
jgi:hypothetical protein